MPNPFLPKFPYGAVYFRKSNPPAEDWEQDYQTAAQDGMNIFRHWFLWSAIEIAPGVFDWEDYDRQLDLAAQQGIKTIIAEMITAAPEWAYRTYSHARLETNEGQKIGPSMGGSCVTGGFPGLCLDHPDFHELAENFLRTLAARYKGHPGLGGYDIWNECNYAKNVCYCPATEQRFREWLKGKYGDLRSLGKAWLRFSFAEWEDVTIPRQSGPYPDTLDWLEFRIDNAYKEMRWRSDVIRAVDPECAITAHGIAASFTNLAAGGSDDWRAAGEVESYGATWGSSRHGDEPWKQLQAFDLVRASARGKPFWHAEHYGGPLWMQAQVIGKPRDEGRIAGVEDIRYWSMVSLAAGASGFLYLRWRPLLDGPLFGAFGPYGMDGSRTERSEMVRKVGEWIQAPEQENLLKSRPVKGEVGILFIPETQIFTVAQQGSANFYSQSMNGVYRGFFDNNIQADWVHIDDIDRWKLLYLPFPVMLKRGTVEKLKAWVAAGGSLIAEGCPAYFGDRGHVGTQQPNFGLDEVFGAKESDVEFTPDLLDSLSLKVEGRPIWGGIFKQTYQPTTGTAVGWYEDGSVAAVDHLYGKGRTRLIGSMAGYGHGLHAGGDACVSTPFFASLLSFAGQEQHVLCSDSRVKARLHAGEGGVYLWVLNPTRMDIPVTICLGKHWDSFSSAKTKRGAEVELRADGSIRLIAAARDAAVFALG